MLLILIGPDPCDENPCKNNGTCVNLGNGKFNCTCPKGFTGPRCRKGKSFIVLWSGFQLIVENNWPWVLFRFTSLCDWFAKITPLFQPTRSKTKTNLDLNARICPLHVFSSNSDWFIRQFVSVVIGQGNCSGFSFTTLNWKLLFFLFNFRLHWNNFISLFL